MTNPIIPLRKIKLPKIFVNIYDFYNHCAGCFNVAQKFIQDISGLDPIIYRSLFEKDGFSYSAASNGDFLMRHQCGIIITLNSINGGNEILRVDCAAGRP